MGFGGGRGHPPGGRLAGRPCETRGLCRHAPAARPSRRRPSPPFLPRNGSGGTPPLWPCAIGGRAGVRGGDDGGGGRGSVAAAVAAPRPPRAMASTRTGHRGGRPTRAPRRGRGRPSRRWSTCRRPSSASARCPIAVGGCVLAALAKRWTGAPLRAARRSLDRVVDLHNSHSVCFLIMDDGRVLY